jgi:CubicO group peptidase (beta-lactamase class C family)
MTAGLEWNETVVPFNDHNDFFRLQTTDDPVGLVLTKEVRDTLGSRWNYNSGLTELTAGVIENLTGESLVDYAEEVLFGPLGIIDYEWRRPATWPSDSFPSASAGLRMRARDLAKIASLILHDGEWKGRQIVPTEWVAASTSRHVQDIPWGSPLEYGYGYFWYPLRRLGGHRAIRASGYGDQAVFLLPDAGLAITIFAGNYDDPNWALGEWIVGAIVRALR